jgi:hypothetical protein
MNGSKKPFEEQSEYKGAEITKKNLEEKVLERMQGVKLKYKLREAYDIQALREEMNMHFMMEIAKGNGNGALETYKSLNANLNECFNTAINGGKALAQYSMQRFTDYSNKTPHKYRNFISHFADNLTTISFVPLSESLRKSSENRYDRAPQELFVYNDRLKIVNNIMSALAFRKEERKFEGFLQNFASEYASNPKSEKLDKIIEQQLIPLAGKVSGESGLKTYQDRANYERQGIFQTIRRNIRNYLGGFRYDR